MKETSHWRIRSLYNIPIHIHKDDRWRRYSSTCTANKNTLNRSNNTNTNTNTANNNMSTDFNKFSCVFHTKLKWKKNTVVKDPRSDGRRTWNWVEENQNYTCKLWVFHHVCLIHSNTRICRVYPTEREKMGDRLRCNNKIKIKIKKFTNEKHGRWRKRVVERKVHKQRKIRNRTQGIKRMNATLRTTVRTRRMQKKINNKKWKYFIGGIYVGWILQQLQLWLILVLSFCFCLLFPAVLSSEPDKMCTISTKVKSEIAPG